MPHKEQGSMRVTTQTAAGIVPDGDLSDNLAGFVSSRPTSVVRLPPPVRMRPEPGNRRRRRRPRG
jgi:hypothetical protein